MGSSHGYDVRGGVEATFNPDEIGDEIGQADLKRKLEEKSGSGRGGRGEDLSDMVLEHSGKTAAKKKEKNEKKKENYKF